MTQAEKDHARLAEIERAIHALRSERGQITARMRRATTRAIEREQLARRKASVFNPTPPNERAEREGQSA